jgi:hypothetical protein
MLKDKQSTFGNPGYLVTKRPGWSFDVNSREIGESDVRHENKPDRSSAVLLRCEGDSVFLVLAFLLSMFSSRMEEEAVIARGRSTANLESAVK